MYRGWCTQGCARRWTLPVAGDWRAPKGRWRRERDASDAMVAGVLDSNTEQKDPTVRPGGDSEPIVARQRDTLNCAPTASLPPRGATAIAVARNRPHAVQGKTPYPSAPKPCALSDIAVTCPPRALSQVAGKAGRPRRAKHRSWSQQSFPVAQGDRRSLFASIAFTRRRFRLIYRYALRYDRVFAEAKKPPKWDSRPNGNEK